jgi:DnaA family protein
MNKFNQLTLNIRLRDDATFANFYSENNQQLLTHLQTNTDLFIYLWGKSGSGRSHLLQATCQAAKSAIYLPITTKLEPEILSGLENMDVLCLDDIHHIAGIKTWEEAIFHLFNKLATNITRLIISANTPPASLPIMLPDLKSRLASGITFQVQPLSDQQKLTALQLRAKNRGLQLSQEVGEFLLNRYARDTNSLFTILEKLDQASLATQRKLTIPFIKTIL